MNFIPSIIFGGSSGSSGGWKSVSSNFFISGFNRYEPSTLPTLAWDDSTRTFTSGIQSGETTFSYWADSVEVTKSGGDSLQIPDVKGTYYYYYDKDGVLHYVDEGSIDLSLFYINAIIFYVCWNREAQEGLPYDERHGNSMAPVDHMREHLTYGVRYEGGLGITGLSDGSGVYTSISAGVIWDEDVRHSLDGSSTHPFLYRDGLEGGWRLTSVSSNVSYRPVGASYDVWNEFDGTTWKLTEGLRLSDFWMIFQVAQPDIRKGSYHNYKMLGQVAYANKGTARDAIWTEMSRIKADGLPTPEMKFIRAWIVKRDGTLVLGDDGSTHVDLVSDRSPIGSTSTVVAGFSILDDEIGDSYTVKLSHNTLGRLVIPDGTTSITFDIDYADNSALSSLEGIVQVDNSGNSVDVTSITFTGTWVFEVSNRPTSVGTGVTCLLSVFNDSDSSVRASWGIDE